MATPPWTLTKRRDKNSWWEIQKVVLFFKKMLQVASHKELVYSHLPAILQTIHVRGTRHAEYWYTIRDRPISDIHQ